MNEMKTNREVTLSDLRQLGKEGGATAFLTNGEEMFLYPNYGTVRRRGVIAGKAQEVDMIETYPRVYPKIRTIKRKGILVARRMKQANRSVLLLTGAGYHRKD